MSLYRVLEVSWIALKRKFHVGFRWPVQAQQDHYFSPEEVAAYHRASAKNHSYTVDDASWNDLLIDDYLKTLSKSTSIFAQQIFYDRLRTGLDQARFYDQQHRLQTLIADQPRQARLEQDCEHLRVAETEIASLLFEPLSTSDNARWHRYAWAIPLSAGFSVALGYLNPLGFIFTALIICFLFHLQIQFHNKVYLWNRNAHSLQLLLKTSYQLSTYAEPEFERFRRINADVIACHQQLQRSSTARFLPTEIQAYLDWFQMANIRHYFKGIRTLHKFREVLQTCYLEVAQLEADIKLVRHFQAHDYICFATTTNNHGVALTQFIHPLLDHASPLSLAVQKGCFISGQNGIGKSTLLRAIGLNLVVGNAFGFCYAKQALIDLRPVYTSIHNEDSLSNNESFYIAEMKRAKALVDAANGQHPGIYLIDEIFRGTNYMESVSAAAAVLKELSQKGLLIVASHHLILANLLNAFLKPLSITRRNAKLQLQPGLLDSTNGIQLLTNFNFGQEIEANANHVFNQLNRYMTSDVPKQFQIHWH